MELVHGLSERLREGNLLIANLQQRLALPEAREPKPAELATKSKRTNSNATEKGSTMTAKPAKSK